LYFYRDYLGIIYFTKGRMCVMIFIVKIHQAYHPFREQSFLGALKLS
jgi:hypothetical protein